MEITFQGQIEQFPGKGGWVYVSVPVEYNEFLKMGRKAWGMYPIIATIGDFSWGTKLMMKKGGDFFVALKASVRNKKNISIGNQITIQYI